MKRREVYWIDDECNLFFSFSENYLKKHNINITFIRTPIRAMKELKDRAKDRKLPDAIFLDIMMPEFDPLTIDGKIYKTQEGHTTGLVLYQYWLKNFIEKNNKHIPIIALTNLNTSEKIVKEIKESGMIFIPKSTKNINQKCIDVISEGIV